MLINRRKLAVSVILKIDQELLDNQKLKIEFHLQTDKEKKYEYSYYVYRDGKVTYRKDKYSLLIPNYCECLEIPLVFSGAYRVLIFLKEDGKVIQKISTTERVYDARKATEIFTTFENEKVFFHDIPIKYMFEKHNQSNQLAIVFSGIYKDEFRGIKDAAKYNYIRTLEPIKINKLFILDNYFGKFCYYLGEDGNSLYESATLALITKIMNQLNVPKENVLTIGSSKGGTAALYFGLKYGYQHIIVGAPQIFPGEYLKNILSKRSTFISKRLFEIINEEEPFSFERFNRLITNELIMCDHKPNISIHIGSGDTLYQTDILPFQKLCIKQGINPFIEVSDYSDHGLTGTYFSPFLLQRLDKLL